MTVEVTDKLGRRVTRANGILQDGDRLAVPMRIMDSANSALLEAAARAEAARRIEQFDASHGVGHRPGYAAQDAGNSGFTAREARDAAMRDAWKNPSAVIVEDKADKPDANKPVAVVPPTAPKEQLAAARDAVVAARDKRLEAAWQG
jgi:hypothetical protein